MQIFNGRYEYIKKKMISIAIVFPFLLLCAGCGKRQVDVKQEEA